MMVMWRMAGCHTAPQTRQLKGSVFAAALGWETATIWLFGVVKI